MNIADPAPESPDSPLRTTTMKLPSRDQVTAVQINTLLQAVQVLNHLAIARGGVTENAGGPNDGGMCAALDSSIIRALSQLDGIFDDSPRWTLASQNTLEKQLSDVYAAQLDLLQVQKQAVLEVGLPHRIAGPKLLQLAGGAWAAVLGDAAHMSNCIFGMGDSPMAALLDFDEVFNGTKNNEQKPDNVDERGISTGENPPNNGTDIRGNRPENGPDGGVSPT